MEDVVRGVQAEDDGAELPGCGSGAFPDYGVSPSQPTGNYRFSQFPVQLWAWGRRYSQASEPETGQGDG